MELIDQVLAGRKRFSSGDHEKFSVLVDLFGTNDTGDDRFVLVIITAAVKAYVQDQFFNIIVLDKINYPFVKGRDIFFRIILDLTLPYVNGFLFRQIFVVVNAEN